jgi:hypothetical protein
MQLRPKNGFDIATSWLLLPRKVHCQRHAETGMDPKMKLLKSSGFGTGVAIRAKTVCCQNTGCWLHPEPDLAAGGAGIEVSLYSRRHNTARCDVWSATSGVVDQ